MDTSKMPSAMKAANPIVAKKATKKTGSFQGKSNTLGQGGRAAQLISKGVPPAVVGSIARSKQAASGQKNYH